MFLKKEVESKGIHKNLLHSYQDCPFVLLLARTKQVTQNTLVNTGGEGNSLLVFSLFFPHLHPHQPPPKYDYFHFLSLPDICLNKQKPYGQQYLPSHGGWGWGWALRRRGTQRMFKCPLNSGLCPCQRFAQSSESIHWFGHILEDNRCVLKYGARKQLY